MTDPRSPSPARPTPTSPPPPSAEARVALQRVATHVLARRRFQVTGRFGLRASPAGLATPLFGDGEVIRITGTAMVHETTTGAVFVALAGATLADLAELVGADLAADFSCGPDTPALGDPHEPIELAAADASAVAEWFGLGAAALDATCARLPATSTPAVAQLWPEHFDLGTNVGVGPGPDDRVNLGASPGDGAVPEPYLYVGPWSTDRPGDPGYWNVDFGAVLRWAEVMSSPDPLGAAVAFFARGLQLLTG